MSSPLARITGPQRYTIFSSSCRTAALSAVFLMASAFLLFLHASSVRQVQEVGLPAAVTIPPLEERLTVLREQLEVSELQQTLADGSAGEMVQTFVLPTEAELDRVLSLLEFLHNQLAQGKYLRSMSEVRAGGEERPTDISGVLARPFSFSVEVTEEGLQQILSLVRLSGLVTVADALTTQAIEHLLKATEEENPASIATIEHFLATPLLRYAREPKPFEEQVLRSFASPVFEQAFTDLLRHSLLAEARTFFGSPFGHALAEAHLWPMRFLTIDQITVKEGEGGWENVGVEMRAYARPKDARPHP